MTPLDVLLIEDEEMDATLLTGWLRRDAGLFKVEWAKTLHEALQQLSQRSFHAAVLDLNLPDAEGLNGLTPILGAFPQLAVVVLTSLNDDNTALKAVRLGAQDYLIKGRVQRELFTRTVRYAVERKALAFQPVTQAEENTSLPSLPESGLVAVSPAMAKLRPFLNKAAHGSAPVLITGEQGTGKEMVARALHHMGPRAGAPFVSLNCASLPEPLAEIELFGQVGQGSIAAKQGLFLAAEGGTLFLDDIGDMPLGLQTKVLRALQSKTVRAVGGREERSFNVRVLAATHRPLSGMVENQSFRQDLYFRLKVLDLHVPPLRERVEDIPVLAQHFLRQADITSSARAISEAAVRLLMGYTWPGNVRELQNCMENAAALSEGPMILPVDLPQEVRDPQVTAHLGEPGDGDGGAHVETLSEMERHHIVRILAAFDNNRTRASQALGISRRTLQRKLIEYALVSDEDENHA